MSDQNVMLSTVDNPWNPWTHFSEWYAFDESFGYHSSSLLAHVAKTFVSDSDDDETTATQLAINEIVTENVSGMHRKVPFDGEFTEG